MRQSFTVTSPAPDKSLVTIQQLRIAAGLEGSDNSRDAELLLLGEAISADIATACNVADDGVSIPTLRRETIVETFWLSDRWDELFLSRRFVSAISVVTEAGVTLVPADHALDRAAGLLSRSRSGRPCAWGLGEGSVTYDAGFDTVPADLAAAALDLARIRLSSGSRDPLVKSESIEVPDIQTKRQDFWVGALPGSAAGPVPADILARLSRYMNVALA